jgi:hypothetical protein
MAADLLPEIYDIVRSFSEKAKNNEANAVHLAMSFRQQGVKIRKTTYIEARTHFGR